jgi:ADP-ribose pyrophosphatase YjhB (NUDIX family)
MLSFHTGTHQFHLRAACIAVHRGAVLLHRAQGDAFWALPGGRVEAGEEAAHAVVREMQEELAAKVQVLQLSWMVENFFEYRGQCHHEIGMYFLAELDAGSPLLASVGPFWGSEAGKPLEFAWFRTSELAAVDIRPAFLSTLLAENDFTFRHVVHHDQQPLESHTG